MLSMGMRSGAPGNGPGGVVCAAVLSLITIYTLSIVELFFGMSNDGTLPCKVINSVR